MVGFTRCLFFPVFSKLSHKTCTAFIACIKLKRQMNSNMLWKKRGENLGKTHALGTWEPVRLSVLGNCSSSP